MPGMKKMKKMGGMKSNAYGGGGGGAKKRGDSPARKMKAAERSTRKAGGKFTYAR